MKTKSCYVGPSFKLTECSPGVWQVKCRSINCGEVHERNGKCVAIAGGKEYGSFDSHRQAGLAQIPSDLEVATNG